MQTGLGLKWRSILERKMGRSHQLPGASFCIRQQQAKVNERLSFCWHTGSAITCTGKNGVLATILSACESTGHIWQVLQGAKGLALAQVRFQSTRGG